jgi:signal transduction histidine kinase
MSRIRGVFVLLALGIAIPVALLVRGAFASLALERQVRHQAVAERVFDEMERGLSELLLREEARDFGHYAFYWSPEGSVGGRAAVVRSPLAPLPSEAHVVGWFQIDPDGSFRSPHLPRDVDVAERSGDFAPSPELDRRLARIESLVSPYFETARREAADPSPDSEPAKRQAPGTTLDLARAKKDAPSAEAPAAPGVVAQARDTAEYEVLRSLNRGAEGRFERKQKVSEEAAERVYGQRPPEADADLGLAAVAKAEARGAAELAAAPPPPSPAAEPAQPAETEAQRLDAAEEIAAAKLSRLAASPPAAQAGKTTAPQPAKPRTVRVALDPMVGRRLDDTHLLLYRTALVGDRGYRQGLVLDLAALGESLRARALAGDLAEHGALRFAAAGGAAPPAPDGGFAYRHRFAEPFDALAAELELRPLPGVATARPLWTLAGLLAVLGSLGLAAAYRMVAVTVDFAERRNNFVSAVTHELKTPLTAIRMYAEMLRDGIVPSEGKRREYHETMTAEADRLGRLIDNVLEFARLEKGTREMNLVVGSPADAAQSVARMLAPHAERLGFRLELAVEPDLPPARFDRDALLQILVNLVDNAIKYARDATEKRVLLECRRHGDGVQVVVRDFGPGVPARQLSRIFEPFHRGEPELTRTTQGSGLGLALVRALATRMGAAVRGRNAEGGGFEVALDLAGAA